MKYYIIPDIEVACEISAEDKDEAMALFAANMDSDMNSYFKAVTMDELEIIRKDRMSKAHKTFVKAWMSLTLQTDFDMNEKDADNLATVCYDTYCQGDGLTEYEAVEKTYEFTKEEELASLENMSEQYHAVIFGKLELYYGPETIEVRDYREDLEGTNTFATVSRGCLTAEEVSDLADKHKWLYSET